MRSPIDLKEIKILWLDLQTTGLNENRDSILEIGMIVTDGLLGEVDAFSKTISASTEQLSKMNNFVQSMHYNSGLLSEIEDSSGLDVIEDRAVEFLERHFNEKVVLHGNSIHFDRRFIRRHMWNFESLLNHKMVDVASFKESFATYKPETGFQRQKTSRSIDDIKESIKEYKAYLENLGLLEAVE